MRKLQKNITRLFAVLFLLSLTYISKAQEMSYNGNKATATCEVEIVAYPGGDGYYHQIPVFTYQWVCSDIYEKYTSFLRKGVTGNVSVYLVWSRQKDNYGNKEKVEKFLGVINLSDLRKYQSSSLFVKNSKEVSDIFSAYMRYRNELARDRSVDFGKAYF